jgi:hypothetical protein
VHRAEAQAADDTCSSSSRGQIQQQCKAGHTHEVQVYAERWLGRNILDCYANITSTAASMSGVAGQADNKQRPL